MNDIERDVRALLMKEDAIIDETDVAWVSAKLTQNLVTGYDTAPEVYREHVHDVVGALIGLGVSPTVLRRMIEVRSKPDE